VFSSITSAGGGFGGGGGATNAAGGNWWVRRRGAQYGGGGTVGLAVSIAGKVLMEVQSRRRCATVVVVAVQERLVILTEPLKAEMAVTSSITGSQYHLRVAAVAAVLLDGGGAGGGGAGGGGAGGLDANW
jgi:hypothetical protein